MYKFHYFHDLGCNYEISNLGNVRVKEIWLPMYNDDEEEDCEFEMSNFGNVRVKEIWKRVIIDNENTEYEVSIYGNFRNMNTQYIFKLARVEYIRCSISKSSYLIHRLMAQTFLENIDNKPYVNHIDGNKHNNVLYNLEWSTSSYNTQHAYINNLIKKKCKSILQFDLNGNYIKTFKSMTDVCNTFNISFKLLRKVVQGKLSHIKNMVFKYEIQPVVVNDLHEFYELYLNKNYLIHKNGRVYSKLTKQLLKPRINTGGYLVISGVINKLLHVLLATQFLENIDNKSFVNHKDGNKTNNNLDNLEWVTCQENNLHAYEMELNKRQIAVKQYTLDGIYIKTFRSISLACLELNFPISIVNVINNCCKGYYKHAKNYIWRYEHDTSIVESLIEPHGKKPIYRYTLDGVFDTEYKCINDALKKLNIKEGQTIHISKCCKGIVNTAHGYRWKYKKDVFDKRNLDAISNDNQVSVHQCDLNDVILHTHNSITQAAKSVGKQSLILIKKCCNNEIESAYGYKWKYVNKSKKNIKQIETDIKINQYSLTGDFIKSYDTCDEAAKSINSTQPYRIRQCCEGTDRKKIGEFYWKYSNDKSEIKLNPMNTPVKQYNLDGTYIKTFKTNKEAANAVGAKNARLIIRCRKGQCNTAHNFIWK